MPVFKKKDPQGWGYSSISTVLAWCAQGPSFNPQHYINQAWWHMPAMLALRRLKQEDHRFKIILICIGSFRSVRAPQNQVNNLTLCFKKLEKEQTKINTEKRKIKTYMTYSRKALTVVSLPHYRHLTLLWPCLTCYGTLYPFKLKVKINPSAFLSSQVKTAKTNAVCAETSSTNGLASFHVTW